jgi:hypothetical protein
MLLLLLLLCAVSARSLNDSCASLVNKRSSKNACLQWVYAWTDRDAVIFMRPSPFGAIVVNGVNSRCYLDDAHILLSEFYCEGYKLVATSAWYCDLANCYSWTLAL